MPCYSYEQKITVIGPKRIVSIQFNFYFTHTKYALNKLNTNTYVEEKNNDKDLEGKKEERERFAECNVGAAGGAKEGVKKLCLRRTLLRPTRKPAFGANNYVSLKMLKN